jgi:hypothetical protein
MEQEQTVYCLLEGRDVFAVMPMGIGGRVGIATLRLLNYIYLSFINFKQT